MRKWGRVISIFIICVLSTLWYLQPPEETDSLKLPKAYHSYDTYPNDKASEVKDDYNNNGISSESDNDKESSEYANSFDEVHGDMGLMGKDPEDLPALGGSEYSMVNHDAQDISKEQQEEREMADNQQDLMMKDDEQHNLNRNQKQVFADNELEAKNDLNEQNVQKIDTNISSDDRYVPPSCKPIKNFSFLKLHRVGSGSFHNVLVQFAINHDAFIALADCPNYQIFPLQATTDLFLPQPRHPKFTGYNMFIDHALFNKSATDQFLQRDTVYITQIRHPFKESYSVYEHFWAGRPHVPYDEFLKDPERYEAPVHILWPCYVAKNYSISRNVMSLELGYTNHTANNPMEFRKHLEMLNDQLIHVSILEELSASLIILRHKLCWEYKEILHLRKHKSYSGNKVQTADVDEQKKRHMEWSSLDYILYEFFLNRHIQEVRKRSPEFHKEVSQFDKDQDKFNAFCSGICAALSGVDTSDTKKLRDIFAINITFQETQFYSTFTKTYQDCAMLQLTELTVKTALKYHMNPGVCQSNPSLAKKLRLSCDESSHILPGLSAWDLKDLLDEQRCPYLSYII